MTKIFDAKKNYLFFLLFIILGCHRISPFAISEINQLGYEFAELELNVNHELQDLRIDIIRQTEEVCEQDGSTSEITLDYHPLGFDLGNGLFYDLNDNLSIRIDELLGLKATTNFKLKKTYFYSNNKESSIYISRNSNNYCMERKGIFGKDRRHCFQRKTYDQGIEVVLNDHPNFNITTNKNTTSIFRGRKNRLEYAITKTKEGEYKVSTTWRKMLFSLNENEISIDNRYLIRSNQQDGTITIYQKRSKRLFLLYTIKRDAQNIYFYDKRYFGKKIALQESEVAIYLNQRKFCEYSRVE